MMVTLKGTIKKTYFQVENGPQLPLDVEYLGEQEVFCQVVKISDKYHIIRTLGLTDPIY